MRRLPQEDRDGRLLRDAFACFPSGVTALCGLVDSTPVGMAASSFTSVSIAPPLVSVCIQSTSSTWQSLRALPRLGVSVLGAGQDAACRQLAARAGDRFAGIDWEASADGAVFVHGAAAWFDCSVEQEIAAGDHEIVLMRIHGVTTDATIAPLVFHASRFRQLVEL